LEPPRFRRRAGRQRDSAPIASGAFLKAGQARPLWRVAWGKSGGKSDKTEYRRSAVNLQRFRHTNPKRKRGTANTNPKRKRGTANRPFNRGTNRNVHVLCTKY